LTAPPFINISLFIKVALPPGSSMKHQRPPEQLRPKHGKQQKLGGF